MRILMVSPVNYGPEYLDGIKKILYNIIKRNKFWQVDFISFKESVNMHELSNVKNYFVENNFYIDKKMFFQPVLVSRYDLGRMGKLVRTLALQNDYDVIVCVTSILAKLIEFIPENQRSKTILLAIDLLSLFWQRRVEKESLVKKILYKAQLAQWENYEKKFLDKFRSVVFVSSVDAEMCKTKYNSNNIEVIENGINIESFNCNMVYRDVQENRSMIFTGNMNYLPNKAAAKFLIESIYPVLKKEISDMKLYIVGIGASKLAIDIHDGSIIIQDYVEDMAEYLLKARIYVSPLVDGAGIKNKILEAMATGRLIVGSVISFDGIHGLSEGDVLIASSLDEYVSKIKQCMLYEDDKIDVIQAKLFQLVCRNYSWDGIAQRYDNLFYKIKKGDF